MKKTYSKFNYEDLAALGIIMRRDKLFHNVQLVQPSAWLVQTLAINQTIPSSSEKAKSELFITPVLTDITLRNPHQLTYFSGYQFNVDHALGLRGYCDFIISKTPNAIFIKSPIVAIVEAKAKQDLTDAIPQCVAEMFAASIFNKRNHENLQIIYGTITNGHEWLFLRQHDLQVTIDNERYNLRNLSELLGIWQVIIT